MQIEVICFDRVIIQECGSVFHATFALATHEGLIRSETYVAFASPCRRAFALWRWLPLARVSRCARVDHLRISLRDRVMRPCRRATYVREALAQAYHFPVLHVGYN